MKYLISDIRIPLESIPDLFSKFKFIRGQNYYNYCIEIVSNDIVFIFKCNIWTMDKKVSVYSEECDATRDTGEITTVYLPDSIDLEHYLQTIYKEQLNEGIL